jgi:hypothetical protein
MLYGNIAIFDQIPFFTNALLEAVRCSARPPTTTLATPSSTR